jgi:hypothetical protein
MISAGSERNGVAVVVMSKAKRRTPPPCQDS